MREKRKEKEERRDGDDGDDDVTKTTTNLGKDTLQTPSARVPTGSNFHTSDPGFLLELAGWVGNGKRAWLRTADVRCGAPVCSVCPSCGRCPRWPEMAWKGGLWMRGGGDDE